MKNIVKLLLFVCIVSAIAGCNGAGTGSNNGGGDKTYAVGDTGPAGGIVFYDKGSTTNGWRYLEAGSVDLNANNGWSTPTASGVTATSIGTGSQNTTDIISALGTSAYAARQCKLYSYGGYSDWFLPSLDEETQMLSTLALNGLGGFTINVSYWSSSEYNAGYAYREYVYSGAVTSAYYDKTDTGLRIQPVRMF